MGLYVKFTELKCFKQNESWGDEPYLYWKPTGKTIWGPTPDNEGKVGKVWNLQADLGGKLKPIALEAVPPGGGKIELWEYDPDTPDDYLGGHVVEDHITPSKTVTLTGDDAEYQLTFEVKDV